MEPSCDDMEAQQSGDGVVSQETLITNTVNHNKPQAEREQHSSDAISTIRFQENKDSLIHNATDSLAGIDNTKGVTHKDIRQQRVSDDNNADLGEFNQILIKTEDIHQSGDTEGLVDSGETSQEIDQDNFNINIKEEISVNQETMGPQMNPLSTLGNVDNDMPEHTSQADLEAIPSLLFFQATNVQSNLVDSTYRDVPELHYFNQSTVQRNSEGDISEDDSEAVPNSNLADESNSEDDSSEEDGSDDFVRKVNRKKPESYTGRFKCPYCPYRSNKRNNTWMHKIRTHTKVPIYKCEFCDFRTKHRSYMKKHVYRIHEAPQLGLKPTKRRRGGGRPRGSGGRESGNTRERKPRTKRNKGENSKTFKCTVCEFVSNNQFNVDKHYERRHGNSVYKCDVCPFVTKTKDYLSKHIKFTHIEINQLLKCDQCFFTTEKRYNLTRHIKLRHKEDGVIYKCSTCDFESKYKIYLQQHERRKVCKQTFECAVCGFKTEMKKYLRRHISYAHRRRDVVYTCDICGFKTHSFHGLNSHVYLKHVRSKVEASADLILPANVRQSSSAALDAPEDVPDIIMKIELPSLVEDDTERTMKVEVLDTTENNVTGIKNSEEEYTSSTD